MAGPLTGQESIVQLSACTMAAAVHEPPAKRDTWMSRTSVSLRSRNAATGPSPVTATLVEQHSQTRSLTAASASCFPVASKRAYRSAIEPPAGSVVFNSWSRPSSQTTPKPGRVGSGHGNSDAKPCCVRVRS